MKVLDLEVIGYRHNMNQELVKQARKLTENIRRVVVASPDVIELTLLGLLCRGHILLDDFPGVGKTLLAKSLAQSLEADFKRIQFTPDLLPTDITGTSIFDQTLGDFKFVPGPIFANIVLADEINRSSPRTQSALLEAMGEYSVTVDSVTNALPQPFLVIATRNISEAHGTFPLPQSQLDRFLLSFSIGYPRLEEEVEILERHEQGETGVTPVLTAGDIVAMQNEVYRVAVSRPVKEYLANIISVTRNNPEIAVGASPRGAIFLQRAAQARAALAGRNFVTPDDVKSVALPVLRHRIATVSAESATQLLETILSTVPVPL